MNAVNLAAEIDSIKAIQSRLSKLLSSNPSIRGIVEPFPVIRAKQAMIENSEAIENKTKFMVVLDDVLSMVMTPIHSKQIWLVQGYMGQQRVRIQTVDFDRALCDMISNFMFDFDGVTRSI